jgi:hypothetical protein
MYDYFYSQWGTFTNIPGVSSTVYRNLHTYIDQYGRAFQESPGAYLDGSTPVVMQFTTAWVHLAGLQGFERAYFFYLLGNYISQHKLNIGIAYDYNPAVTQQTLIQPDNYSPAYGGSSPYGAGSPFGGPSSVEQWRVFLAQQKCQALQISVQEIFDPTIGAPAGAGLTLSGLNLIVGLKKSYTTISAARSTS